MFALSARGLRHIPTRNYQVKRFVFVVGASEFETTNLCADFISMKLARMHRENPDLDRFELTGVSEKVASKLMMLCQGGSVTIDEEDLGSFEELARQLEAPELYLFLQEKFPKELALSNAIDRLVLKMEMELECEVEKAFVAEHLFEFSSKELAKAPVHALNSVLASGSFDAEKLFALVSALCHEDSKFFLLFEHVKFELLPVDAVSRFIQMCECVKGRVTLDSGVWRALCKRLVSNTEPGATQEETTPASRVTIRFSDTDPLNGILAFLTQKYGGNVHKLNVVTVTASSCYSIRYPENVVDFENEDYFYSKNQPNQWLQYAFRTGTVTVSCYTIKTRQYGGGYHLRSWAIEVSVDKQTWETIDSQDGVDELAEEGRVKSFTVNSSQQVRFIRIRQTGHNSQGSDFMTLARFELFGTFTEDA